MSIETFDNYQKSARATARMGLPRKMELAVLALGLSGEAGEVVDHIKKHLGHGHKLDTEHVKKELGDQLWYIAMVGDWFGLSLSDIAAANIDKLKKRYPNGFSRRASQKRKPGDT